MPRLERLQRLRESRAITDQEFEREKARILAEQWREERRTGEGPRRAPRPATPLRLG